MSEYSNLFIIVVIVVAFIAGYSAVSFVVNKFRGDRLDPAGNKMGGQFGSEHQEQSNREGIGEFSDEQEECDNNQFEEIQYGEEQYARVLGVTGRVTPVEIQKCYRELLKKYHPDKVSHLGSEFQGMAETKTKEINEAYEYFRKKYNIT